MIETTMTDASFIPMGADHSATQLAEAFAEFVSTSARLESSYRQLQEEVSGLRDELNESNEALRVSLTENQRVRTALQQIVDSMPCGVLVVTTDGCVSTINPESFRILGIDSSVQIRTLAQVAILSGLNLSLFTSNDADLEQEFCLRNASGERWLQIGNRQLFRQEGKKAGQTIFILRDITAHKRAERDREAGRKAMALAEITTMLAHEIRNPLASLELFAELIEQDDTRRDEWISNLRAGIRSLSGTVNNVLSFHDSGSLKLTSISLARTVNDTVRFMQPIADQSGVTVQWRGAMGDSSLMGNDSALQQVLLNLIKNAIRHTPSGGTVTVSLATDKASGRLVLECCDSGCGIPANQLGRLFEAGFSGSGDTPGLGLAVCERIVRQHGGNISASNVNGSGARFTIEVPTLSQESATA